MEVITKENPEYTTLIQSLNSALGQLEEIKDSYNPHFNGERFLTDNDLSEKLHISRRTLQDYRDQRKIAFIHIGGKILYRESDVEQMLENGYYNAWG